MAAENHRIPLACQTIYLPKRLSILTKFIRTKSLERG